MRDSFLNAVKIFNKKEEFNIIDEIVYYKIRISKKSGLPDLDLPALNEKLTLKELNQFNLSIVIEEKHIIIIPKKKYNDNFDAMSMKSIKTNSNNSSSPNKKQNENHVLFFKEPLLPSKGKSKTSCWKLFCCCFKRGEN